VILFIDFVRKRKWNQVNTILIKQYQILRNVRWQHDRKIKLFKYNYYEIILNEICRNVGDLVSLSLFILM
jgi:hypothetical protein